MRTCHAWRASCRQRTHPRRGVCTNEPRPFRVNDLVILRQLKDQPVQPILTKPLRYNGRIESHLGILKHDDIIGKSPRDIVRPKLPRSGTTSNVGYRLLPVSLHEYVLRSRRLVTPIYPDDAGLTVSLLDLHPEVFGHGEESDSTLEILEAGTGHGALTLFLSRAIHAANPPRPPVARDDGTAHRQDLTSWKSQRKAVIHTIEVSERISTHARTVVQGFRHGLYADNVDFHVGDVSEWLAKKLPERGGRPFLSHAVLDLPSADTHLSNVADALVTDGTLVVFNPSVTQIGECAQRVLDERIPLELEKVIELGVNGGSGGREWDLRFVHPRSRQTANPENRAPDEQSGIDQSIDSAPATEEESASRARQSEGLDDSAISEEDSDKQALETATDKDDRATIDAQRAAETNGGNHKDAPRRVMVCRPKVGGRVQGGGFLGVWKKNSRIVSSRDT